MIAIPNVRTETFHVIGRVGLDLPVPEKGKSVRVAVSDVVILGAGLLDGLQEMDCLFGGKNHRC